MGSYVRCLTQDVSQLRYIVACNPCNCGGELQMANGRDAEVLEYILTNLRLMSVKAQECGIGPLIQVLEAAAMEAEYQLTGIFLSPTDGLESSRPALSRKSDKPL
jgi:hypothetical protein